MTSIHWYADKIKDKFCIKLRLFNTKRYWINNDHVLKSPLLYYTAKDTGSSKTNTYFVQTLIIINMRQSHLRRTFKRVIRCISYHLCHLPIRFRYRCNKISSLKTTFALEKWRRFLKVTPTEGKTNPIMCQKTPKNCGYIVCATTWIWLYRQPWKWKGKLGCKHDYED